MGRVAEEGLAVFCDVFCEDSAFTLEESRRVLEKGKEHGLVPKIHADQITQMGASRLAAEVGAITAEHLEHIDEGGIEALAQASVIGGLLPGCSFYLGVAQAPARRLLEAGVRLTVATDYNPRLLCRGVFASHALDRVHASQDDARRSSRRSDSERRRCFAARGSGRAYRTRAASRSRCSRSAECRPMALSSGQKRGAGRLQERPRRLRAGRIASSLAFETCLVSVLGICQSCRPRKQACSLPVPKEECVEGFAARPSHRLGHARCHSRDVGRFRPCLVLGVPDTILLVGSDGIILEVKQSESQFPVDLSSSVGRCVTDVLPAIVARRTMGILRESTFGGRTTCAFALAHNDMTAHFEARVIRSGSGEAVIILRDVTEAQTTEAFHADVNAIADLPARELRDQNAYSKPTSGVILSLNPLLSRLNSKFTSIRRLSTTFSLNPTAPLSKL